MKIKVLSAIVAGIMLIPMCLSCQKTSGNENKIDPYAQMLVINEEYSVVRGDTSDSMTTKAAQLVKKALCDATGKDIEIKTDYTKSGEEIPVKEIVVGKTKRDLAFDRTTLSEGEYYIGIEGKRIIIDAYDSALLYYAAKAFIENWLIQGVGIDENGTVVMNEDICAKLNGRPTDLEEKITVLTQNLRYNDDGNGNNIADRAPRFEQLVEQYKPDIIGTQESTPKWNTELKSRFEDEYGIFGHSRNGKMATSGEWNNILYRLDRFEFVEGNTFWLSDTPQKPSIVQGSNHNRICTWALLKDKVSDQNVLIINTHLDSVSVSDQQAKILITQLEHLIKQYPTFVTGDFNFKTKDAGYSVMTKTFDDAMVSAYQNTSNISHTYNGYGDQGSHAIDYIFYNEMANAMQYHIVNDMYNGYVSDHYGVLAKFVIQTK